MKYVYDSVLEKKVVSCENISEYLENHNELLERYLQEEMLKYRQFLEMDQIKRAKDSMTFRFSVPEIRNIREYSIFIDNQSSKLILVYPNGKLDTSIKGFPATIYAKRPHIISPPVAILEYVVKHFST